MKFNITEKLQANEDPVIVVGDVELTVNSDAKTVLQIVELMQDGNFTVDKMVQAKDMLFSPEDVEKLDQMKMFVWKEVIATAAQLAVSGKLGDEPVGELPEKPIMI